MSPARVWCGVVCSFVVFNNLSLQYNSVGSYQLMKVMTTPVIAAIQYFGYGIRMDTKLTLSLIPICLGVILATVNDLELTGTLRVEHNPSQSAN